MRGAPRPGTLLGSCCPLRSQKSPVGAPAPGALWFLSGVALVRTASLESVCPMEDDFSRFSPPASREAKGAEVSADESITACCCEEVDAAVPLAGRGMPRLVYEDAPSSPFGRRWPKRDPARRRTTPSWHDATSARRGTPRLPSPHPETARIKGYPEQHFQHTQMDAERLNQLEARLENLGQRLEDLRGYL